MVRPADERGAGMSPPLDPLRRVILATVAADPDETAAAYDALTDEDLRLIETYTGAIIRAAVMVGAADRPTRAVSHD